MNQETDNRPLMVSIHCITYNHEPYIRQCLEGFVMQKTNFRFEAIVHDDASTDGTADIIREYTEKYPDIIKPIFETENQYSKYDGSLDRIMDEACTGKYIALCEGDDYWTNPNKLQKQVDFLESHLDYSMCFHRALLHYEDGRQADTIFAKIEDRDYDGAELNENWICATASVMVRKEINESELKNVVNNDKKLICADTPLFLTAATFGKIRGMSDLMSVYRKQENGVSYSGIPYERMIQWGLYEYEIYKVFGEKYKLSAIRKAVNVLTQKCFIDSLSQARFRPKPLILSLRISPKTTLKLLFSHYFKSITNRIS